MESKMIKVLITGGAGFIGSNLANTLVSKGYMVRVLDNLNPQIHGANPIETSPLFSSLSSQIEFIQASVTDRKKLIEAISGQDILVHFAAETGTGQSMYEIERYSNININGTALILDILTNTPHQVKKMVVASSRAIYGEGRYLSDSQGYVYPDHRSDAEMAQGNFEVTLPGTNAKLELVPTDEDSKIHPSSVYGITKQVQEQLVMTVCPAIGIAPVAFRYQNVYGPGQSLSNPYTGILSIFSTRMLQGKSINVFEDGLESRDFVYISDVVNATILGIENEAANGKVFNVGSGIPTTVIDVVRKLMRFYEVVVPVSITGNYRLGDIRHNYADLNRIQRFLGFTPEFSFDQGLEHFCKWVKAQSIQHDNYDLSLNEMKERGLFK